jgi:hypothetical protein
VLLLMPRPFPAAELEAACADAWWWPEAAQVLTQHSAHLIVMLHVDGKKTLDRVLRLTRLTAALAATTDSCAVYWSETGVLHPPDSFLHRAQEMRQGHLPVMLWISFQPCRNEKGQPAVFTSGMKSFGLMEIEVTGTDRDPDDVMDYVLGVAHYLLEKGPVLDDADTFGFSEDDRHPVSYGPSMLDREETVIRLVM